SRLDLFLYDSSNVLGDRFTDFEAIWHLAQECPSCGWVGAKPVVSPVHSLSASSCRPISRSAAHTTRSSVKPKFFKITSPGADAPKWLIPMIVPSSPAQRDQP